MNKHPGTQSPVEPLSLPLGCPRELWLQLSPSKQALLRHAQDIIEVLAEGITPMADLCERVHCAPARLVAAVRLLTMLQLVATGPGAMLRLVARPQEPLRVRGPDGHWRWVFVRTRQLGERATRRLTWS